MGNSYDEADRKYHEARARERKARALAFTVVESDLSLTRADLAMLRHCSRRARDEMAFYAGMPSPSDKTWSQMIALLERTLERVEEAKVAA